MGEWDNYHGIYGKSKLRRFFEVDLLAIEGLCLDG